MTSIERPMPREVPSSVDEFLQRGQVHPRLLIPVLLMRPGQALFAVRLEFEHYRPGTARNDDFHVMRFPWMEQLWVLYSIPRRDRAIADQVAAQSGMRLANGEPHVLVQGQRVTLVSVRYPNGEEAGLTPFPVRGPHVFALENDYAHPDWQARSTHPEAAIAAEMKMVQLIIERHYDTLPYELAPGKTPAWIRCRTCGLTSHNANDVASRYCGHCHKYHLPLPEDP